MRRALIFATLAAAAVSGAAAALYAVASDSTDRDTGTPPGGDLRVGGVCSADFTFSTEVSCGLVGFGDVRFHCRDDADAAPCPRTRSVTLENTGSTRVRLVTISGSRPGERHEAVSQSLFPGARTIVDPHAGDTYLYDIVLRTPGGSARVEITAVS
ncbi:hypothetical protein [Streptomyces cadmiisoli]|uniref:hypothetical protein n=1 Tax=Streptomyces cadmiisoli TaxID=2184053 RepID=UPI003D75A4C8